MEYHMSPGPIPHKTSYVQALKNWDNKVEKYKQKLQMAGPQEPGYDPQDEEIYATLIHSIQDLLDVLDQDRSDIISIKQGLDKINHQGNVYLKHMGG